MNEEPAVDEMQRLVDIFQPDNLQSTSFTNPTQTPRSTATPTQPHNSQATPTRTPSADTSFPDHGYSFSPFSNLIQTPKPTSTPKQPYNYHTTPKSLPDHDYSHSFSNLIQTQQPTSTSQADDTHRNDSHSSVEQDANVESLNRRIKILKSKVATLTTQLEQPPRFSVKYIENKDSKTRFYTGFPSWKAFEGVFRGLLKKKVSTMSVNNKCRKFRWHKNNKFNKKPGPRRTLSLMDEFLLVMMRLRLGLLEEDLGDRFSISQSAVSRLLNKWIPKMAKALKKLIRMPPKEQVRQITLNSP